jgi:hypothetical protein
MKARLVIQSKSFTMMVQIKRNRTLPRADIGIARRTRGVCLWGRLTLASDLTDIAADFSLSEQIIRRQSRRFI